ncbi:hypothetical protein HZA43_05010 [Candidatus Peregrinibacteria bacterium]|nr:hypothetical protein [Candidatus Peregrinibacteria bacterium]
MDDLSSRLASIEARNARVEADKAWETSWFRKIVIAGLTYLVVALFFVVAKLPNPWANAVVPTLGFTLSTLTMPLFKRLWMEWFYKD